MEQVVSEGPTSSAAVITAMDSMGVKISDDKKARKEGHQCRCHSRQTRDNISRSGGAFSVLQEWN